ncbi:hypothetical protein B0A49_06369 [Cryomyces minteri]|uniref:Uncharacterized protein n=1 Tax=Cryomyces minteri TaxID=331657 RepID=A0A4U0XCH5_9PEZI|nr:hypothetical protein B0A49_06369 [Cryomyces minteri]
MDIPGGLTELEKAPFGAPDNIVLLGDAALEDVVGRTVNWLDMTVVEDIVAEALDNPCEELVETPIDATDVEELDTIMDELPEVIVDMPDDDGPTDEPIEELDEGTVELDGPLEELDGATTEALEELPIDAVLELTLLELEEPELNVVLEIAGALEMVMPLLIVAEELDDVPMMIEALKPWSVRNVAGGTVEHDFAGKKDVLGDGTLEEVEEFGELEKLEELVDDEMLDELELAEGVEMLEPKLLAVLDALDEVEETADDQLTTELKELEEVEALVDNKVPAKLELEKEDVTTLVLKLLTALNTPNVVEDVADEELWAELEELEEVEKLKDDETVGGLELGEEADVLEAKLLAELNALIEVDETVGDELMLEVVVAVAVTAATAEVVEEREVVVLATGATVFEHAEMNGVEDEHGADETQVEASTRTMRMSLTAIRSTTKEGSCQTLTRRIAITETGKQTRSSGNILKFVEFEPDVDELIDVAVAEETLEVGMGTLYDDVDETVEPPRPGLTSETEAELATGTTDEIELDVETDDTAAAAIWKTLIEFIDQ